MINISTLVKFHKDDLVFKTKAYVSYIYSCPSCPTDTVCKPCMDSNFIISEKKKIRFDYLALPPAQMIVFTDKKFSIELGKNYFFYLKLRPIKSLQNDQNIWSGDLISVLEDIKI